jgi:cobalamin biosynthesis protein CbiG
MNPDLINKIEVFYDEKPICTIDSDSPSLADIVNKVILSEKIDLKKIKCISTIENFDDDGLTEVLVNTIKSIREQLKSNVDDFTKILSTIKSDQDVEQFYKSISMNKKTE